MSFVISKGAPDPIEDKAELQHGAWVIVGLFLVTITMAVCAHNFLHLPPVLGMMTGLGLLKLFGYYLQRRDQFFPEPDEEGLGDTALALESVEPEIKLQKANEPYNIFRALERAEWDTLMFFYGIILCVGGLGTMGYLSLGSELMYDGLGATKANILVGFLSALIDNIPVMFAVLAMLPEMDHGQWLLVTLTAGVGGSLLSVGCCGHGSGAWRVHLLYSPEVELGDHARLCSQHLGALPGERRCIYTRCGCDACASVACPVYSSPAWRAGACYLE
jgi:hypothetical protein